MNSICIRTYTGQTFLPVLGSVSFDHNWIIGSGYFGEKLNLLFYRTHFFVRISQNGTGLLLMCFLRHKIKIYLNYIVTNVTYICH